MKGSEVMEMEVVWSKKKALVLLSGGQDSTTCLAWALDNFDEVHTVSFDYRQRHSAELGMLDKIREFFGPGDKGGISNLLGGCLASDTRVDLSVLSRLSNSALTGQKEVAPAVDGQLPNTFVPGRNILFLTMASIVAHRLGTPNIVGGMCETDFSGYPDCRDDAIKALQVALNLGMDSRLVLHTPLMWRNKAQTWQLAEELGGDSLVDFIVNHTHTCYKGDHTTYHDWGYGCGVCPACEIRARGYEEYIGAYDS